MATKTWTQTSGNLASTDANWSGGTKPVGGDNIVFNATSSANCTWDLDSTLGTFTLDTGYGGVVTQASQIGVTSFTLKAGTFTGNVSYPMVLNGGSFSRTGGTLTPHVLYLQTLGSAVTVTLGAANSFIRKLQVSGGSGKCTIVETGYYDQIIVDTDNELAASSWATIYWIGSHNSAYTLENYGTISGASAFIYQVDSLYGVTTQTAAFGTVTCPVEIWSGVTSGVSSTLNLSGNAVLTSTLKVYSTDDTAFMTLSHGSNYTLTVTGLTTIGTRGKMTQGAGTWAFNGGVTQSGVSSLFTQGGNVTTTTYTLTDGIFTGSTSYTLTCSENFNANGGVITDNTVKLVMSGSGKTLYANQTDTHAFNTLTINDNTSSTANCYFYNLTIASGKTLTQSADTEFKFYYHSASTYSNLGTIAAGGSTVFWVMMYDANKTITFGTISCPLYIVLDSTANNSYTLTLGANATLGSQLYIYSNHGTYNITLSHGSNYTLSVTGGTVLDTRGRMTQGTGAWTFTGGLTLSGTLSLFTQGGDISTTTYYGYDGTLTGSYSHTFTCSSDFLITSGAVTDNTIQLITTGVGSPTITADGITFASITTNTNTTIAASCHTYGFTVASGKYLYINTDCILEVLYYTGHYYSNLGYVSYTSGVGGTLRIILHNSSRTITFGNISANTEIYLSASAVADRTLTMSAIMAFGGSLTVGSLHGTYAMTLDLNGYTLSCKDLIPADRGFVQGGRITVYYDDFESGNLDKWGDYSGGWTKPVLSSSQAHSSTYSAKISPTSHTVGMDTYHPGHRQYGTLITDFWVYISTRAYIEFRLLSEDEVAFFMLRSFTAESNWHIRYKHFSSDVDTTGTTMPSAVTDYDTGIAIATGQWVHIIIEFNSLGTANGTAKVTIGGTVYDLGNVGWLSNSLEMYEGFYMMSPVSDPSDLYADDVTFIMDDYAAQLLDVFIKTAYFL